MEFVTECAAALPDEAQEDARADAAREVEALEQHKKQGGSGGGSTVDHIDIGVAASVTVNYSYTDENGHTQSAGSDVISGTVKSVESAVIRFSDGRDDYDVGSGNWSRQEDSYTVDGKTVSIQELHKRITPCDYTEISSVTIVVNVQVTGEEAPRRITATFGADAIAHARNTECPGRSGMDFLVKGTDSSVLTQEVTSEEGRITVRKLITGATAEELNPGFAIELVRLAEQDGGEDSVVSTLALGDAALGQDGAYEWTYDVSAAGTYAIREVNGAIAGKVLTATSDSASVEFARSATGELKEGKYEITVSYLVAGTSGRSATLDMTNAYAQAAPAQGTLVIKKHFENNVVPDGLEGVLFNIYDSGDALVASAVATPTGSGNMWSAELKLAPGTYTVSEAAADAYGYALSGVQFANNGGGRNRLALSRDARASTPPQA